MLILILNVAGPYFQVKMLRINVIFAGLWVAFQSGKCVGLRRGTWNMSLKESVNVFALILGYWLYSHVLCCNNCVLLHFTSVTYFKINDKRPLAWQQCVILSDFIMGLKNTHALDWITDALTHSFPSPLPLFVCFNLVFLNVSIAH